MGQTIREQLLAAFSEANGDYISGQQLAEKVGCSRTAIWKHIEQLRKAGYEVAAVRKKGYQIISTPNKLSREELLIGLNTKKFGTEIVYKDTVTSTQQIAKKLVVDGAKEGTIVIAEHQTEGRGRLSRTWESPSEKGIWLSLIVRPNIPLQQTPQLTLLAAVALAQVIDEYANVSTNIKWPNDILINGKKVAGILTELQAEQDKVSSVIIGIGINVNQVKNDFPEELKETATSLNLETTNKVNRKDLIQSLLLTIEKLYELYLTSGFSPIKLLWESYSETIGKEITAVTQKNVISGLAIGITDDGILQIKDKENKIHNIYSADIN